MNANRFSVNFALASQAVFAILLSFAPWNVAAYGALSLAAVALAVPVTLAVKQGTRIDFPRLPLGVFLCFASMSLLTLHFKGETLFPYTGLFFALGLAASSLADAFVPALKGRSLRSITRRSLVLGTLYSIAAILHIAFFPHLSYLYFGVGGLVLVSAFDIASGIRHAIRSRLGLAALACFSLLAVAPRADAQETRTEEEIFQSLFGEEVEGPAAQASSEDVLRIASIEVETPECFTVSYIRSFARELEVGQRLTRAELEKALWAIRERLDFSHRFYQAALSYRTADAKAGGATAQSASEVAVKIAVSDGFWWDFNYEPYDLSIGYNNLFRSGKELRAIAGLNAQALRYRDPSIADGNFYYEAELGHRLKEDANVADAAYLYESLSGVGEAGLAVGDDLRLGFGLGYAAYRAAEEYFLYPDYAAPDPADLALLGIADGFGSYRGIATFFFRSSLGAYSYQRRGGFKGRVEARLEALVPQAAVSGTGLKTTFAGDLRMDVPRLLRVTLHERLEYFPRDLSGGAIPEPLWADIDEGRYRSGLVSGVIASLSRVSLGLDPLSVIGLGFTRLSLIPELYYEFTVVKMDAQGPSPRWAQNVGILLKGAFSAPVNRIFSLGLAFSLPSQTEVGTSGVDGWDPVFALFLEIE